MPDFINQLPCVYILWGTENISLYLGKTVRENGGQSTYICLGSPTKGGHHNPKFDFDEDILLWGVKILLEFAKIG